MAQLIGVSRRTIEKRLNEYDVRIRSTYFEVTDSELAEIIKEIQIEHPLCGVKQMKGHLLSRGLRVQQCRIREIHWAVDPEGSMMRRLTTINRCRCAVPAPRSLWHIDGTTNCYGKPIFLYVTIRFDNRIFVTM